MKCPTDPLAEFRATVSRRARQSPALWDDSRQLIEKENLPATLDRLRRRCEEQARLDPIREQLRQAFKPGASRMEDVGGEALKRLTGMPRAKALRALCIYFELLQHPQTQWRVPHMTSEAVERFVRQAANPFDLLYEADVASALELGAGDLSLAGELADQYGPPLKERKKDLVLHCLDRLDPVSKLGGPLHPDQARLRRLQTLLGESFRFYGNQDMSDLRPLDERGKLASRYTIVTCWAPATPTFAYEPTRLAVEVIEEDLRRTKGNFRQTRFDGEPALEVLQGGRALLFPSWKFEIHGPVLLLALLARRGLLGVLGAVDSQVFWELLSQLLEDPRYRPPDRPFTPENIPEIFGETYRRLDRLAVGESIDLANLGILRAQFPPVEPEPTGGPTHFSFRYVSIRRGATFTGIPASSTARKFSSMIEESPPWFLTLVPDSTTL